MLCAFCAERRALPLQRRVIDRMKGRPARRFFHLVLTVRNEPHLTREWLTRIGDAFAELRASKLWQSYEWTTPKGRKCVLKILGGFYSKEATYSKERRDWHPHLHVLIEADSTIPREWIFAVRAEWERLTGARVVRLVPMYGYDKKGQKTRKVNLRSVKELVKYVTKTSSFSESPALLREFLDAFEHVRRVQCFGSWLGEDAKAEQEADAAEVIPGHDTRPCSCGQCKSRIAERRLYHVSETVEREGVLELSLFALNEHRPRDETLEEWALRPSEEKLFEQKQRRLLFTDLQWHLAQAGQCAFPFESAAAA
jgi:hypothetical protein